MPSITRKSHNALFAREKALHTHVYISGLKGHHTLEVGLAYYYRGHYIYAFPAGNLIEPIPYSTRRGIAIQGIVSASAPSYDGKGEGLVEESGVRALEKSVRSEWEAREGELMDKGVEMASMLDGEVDSASSSLVLVDSGARVGVEELHGSLTLRGALRSVALDTFTPHHGAEFLAASAPGSRLASRATSPSGLRPIASHVGLVRLGLIKGCTHYSDGNIHETNSCTENASPRPASSVGYLFGLGDHALSTEKLSDSGNVKTGVRVAPCAIHGEDCDGITTTEPWLTEQTKAGRGFVEDVPMLESGSRVMVDWASLLAERTEDVW